jgi:hypothetical protein
MFEEEPKEDFDDLIEAVTEAIKDSERVREILYRMYQEKAISPKTLLALFLKMQVCFSEEKVLGEENAEIGNYVDNIEVSRCEKNIDSKFSSSKEEAFEEYCQKRFDEEKWLKELGIRFNN